MNLLTEARPLDFWSRLLVRVQNEFDQGLLRLPQLALPVEATTDSLDAALGQVAHNKGVVQSLLAELEALQVVISTLAPQLDRVTFDVGIPTLSQRIEATKRVADIYRDHMCQRPMRQPITIELTQSAARLESLRTAGQGESVVAERNRLRTLVRQVPVISGEDAVPYETAVRKLDSDIDMMSSDLQALRIGTQVQLQIGEVLAPVLAKFGVAAAPAPAEAAAAT